MFRTKAAFTTNCATLFAAIPAMFGHKNPANDSETAVKKEKVILPPPTQTKVHLLPSMAEKKHQENEKKTKLNWPNIDELLSYRDVAQKTNNWDNNWDFRDPAEMAKDKPGFATATEEERKQILAELTPKATRNIFLIRHGQYVTGADRDGRKLTPLGREQAAFLGKRFNAAKDKFKLDDCVFSTMIRAQETGQIMQSEMPHFQRECRQDPMLEEGPPYPPDPPVIHWHPKRKAGFHEHGPRIEAAFRKYFHRAKPKQEENSFELLVCHANVIRYFVCRALQYPPEGWLRISLAHTSITWIQIFPSGRVVVKAMGDFGHLPPEKISFE